MMAKSYRSDGAVVNPPQLLARNEKAELLRLVALSCQVLPFA
jgi:hypothetical protein